MGGALRPSLTGYQELSGLPEQASADLNEALEGGYRIYDAGDPERAHQMSAEMDYHWGQVDAAEVLAALE